MLSSPYEVQFGVTTTGKTTTGQWTKQRSYPEVNMRRAKQTENSTNPFQITARKTFNVHVHNLI